MRWIASLPLAMFRRPDAAKSISGQMLLPIDNDRQWA